MFRKSYCNSSFLPWNRKEQPKKSTVNLKTNGAYLRLSIQLRMKKVGLWLKKNTTTNNKANYFSTVPNLLSICSAIKLVENFCFPKNINAPKGFEKSFIVTVKQ
jgi:hypothetical protein